MAMDNQTWEIRQLLLGRTVWTKDGCLTALPKGQRMRFQGMGNGWGAVHFLGITYRERGYQLAANAPAKLPAELLYRMGRPVRLEERPKASACLCRYLMSAPVLLTAEREGNLLRVSAFTAKGALSALTCLRALNTFEKGLPETVTPLEGAGTGKRRKKEARRKEEKPKKDTKKTGKRLNKGGKREMKGGKRQKR